MWYGYIWVLRGKRNTKRKPCMDVVVLYINISGAQVSLRSGICAACGLAAPAGTSPCSPFVRRFSFHVRFERLRVAHIHPVGIPNTWTHICAFLRFRLFGPRFAWQCRMCAVALACGRPVIGGYGPCVCLCRCTRPSRPLRGVHGGVGVGAGASRGPLAASLAPASCVPCCVVRVEDDITMSVQTEPSFILSGLRSPSSHIPLLAPASWCCLCMLDAESYELGRALAWERREYCSGRDVHRLGLSVCNAIAHLMLCRVSSAF